MIEDYVDITVTDNINVINITPSVTDEIVDINISDNREDVTINVTDSIIEVNINKVTSILNATWGTITGTLSAQTDLQNALNAKQNSLSGTGFVKIAGTTISYDNTNYFPYPSGNTTQYIAGDGSLITFPSLSSADKMVTIGRNSTGSTLYKGTIVYINGSTGNRPNFVKAQANAESTSAGTFGVILNDIANNSDGNCVTIGAIDTLDTRISATHPFTTDTLADGDTIYLSPSTAGYVTNVKPSAPNHLVYIGKVVRTSPTNGDIVYRIQNGYELDEIHNVAISSIANNESIFWESSSSLWKNKSIATVLGYIPISLSSLSASSPLSYNSGTGAFSIQVASGSQNGYLSSIDWNTFNNKAAALSGTINTLTYWASSTTIGSLALATYPSLTEISYVKGVTSAIQTQLNGKQATITNPITGTGTSNYISKFNGTGTSINNSLIYDNGTNVGIGTNAPAAKLDILSVPYAANQLGGLKLSNNNNTTYSVDLLYGINGVGASYASLRAPNDGNGWIDFWTNGTEKMRLTAGGNLAIGTTVANGKLTILEATTSLEFNTSSTKSQILSYDRTGGAYKQIELRGSEFIFSPSDVEKMRLTNGGSLGIGTSSPSEKLQILGNIRLTNNNLTTPNTVSSEINNYNGSSNQFKSSSIKFLTGTYVDQGHITLNTSIAGVDQERVRISESGNVGIGTTNFNLAATGRTMLSLSGANSNLIELQVAGTNQAYIYGGNVGNLEIYGYQKIDLATNGGTRLSITSTGNVGIGTTAPTSKLQVNGLSAYANNAAAITGGLTAGAFYYTNVAGDGILKVVI